jgi:hypothetical protein
MASAAPDQQTTQSPAQQAIATAAILALIAQTGTRPYAAHYLSGRLPRAAFIDKAASHVLASMSASRVAGLKAAETTWMAARTPIPITPADQRMITQSVRTITERTAGEPRVQGEESQLVTRIGSLALAQCVQQARTSYATAVADVLEVAPPAAATNVAPDLPSSAQVVWRFHPDARACERCQRLATQTFASPDDAPLQGGHGHCGCTIEPEEVQR